MLHPIIIIVISTRSHLKRDRKTKVTIEIFSTTSNARQMWSTSSIPGQLNAPQIGHLKPNRFLSKVTKCYHSSMIIKMHVHQIVSQFMNVWDMPHFMFRCAIINIIAMRHRPLFFGDVPAWHEREAVPSRQEKCYHHLVTRVWKVGQVVGNRWYWT